MPLFNYIFATMYITLGRKPQQDGRHWSGGCAALEQLRGDIPCPRARRSPNKMVKGVKSHLESNPTPKRNAERAQTKIVCTRTQRSHRD